MMMITLFVVYFTRIITIFSGLLYDVDHARCGLLYDNYDHALCGLLYDDDDHALCGLLYDDDDDHALCGLF
jgi:hypothetical protein